MTARILHPLPAHLDQRTQEMWCSAPILTNAPLADRYWRLVLKAPDMAKRIRPGQFVMLTAQRGNEPWPVLPRPMAIYDTDLAAGTVSVLYGVVGQGTRYLSGFRPGESLYTVGPLGRPFDLPPETGALCLIGRGIGVCSLTELARRARQLGTRVTAVISSRTPQSALGADLLDGLGVQVFLARDSDGSSGPEAVRDLLTQHYADDAPDAVAVCGSHRLLGLAAELCDGWGADLQVSLEARMACGLGYCHGCSNGYPSATEEAPLVCYDGPVFRYAEPAQLPSARS